MSTTTDASTSMLVAIYDELKTKGFGTDDQDINGGDFVEYGGALFEAIGAFLKLPIHFDEQGQICDASFPPPGELSGTMAERWVALYSEWHNSTHTHVMDFPEWLDKYHEGERETLTWIASWDARPVDATLRADPRRATAFSVMDFGDGSIAIKRAWATIGDEGDREWMVAS